MVEGNDTKGIAIEEGGEDRYIHSAALPAPIFHIGHGGPPLLPQFRG
jgi:hypothetical protein